MTFIFHPEAEAEFIASIDYYEDREVALGYDFSTEVFAAIQSIVKYPDAWPVIEDEVRRCLVNRFPYSVLYSIEQNEVYVLAVMHLRRHPDYWKYRY